MRDVIESMKENPKNMPTLRGELYCIGEKIQEGFILKNKSNIIFSYRVVSSVFFFKMEFGLWIYEIYIQIKKKRKERGEQENLPCVTLKILQFQQQ